MRGRGVGGAVATVLALGLVYSQPALADRAPTVERITGVEGGIVPGGGAAVIEGRFGQERLDYAPVGRILEAMVTGERAIEEARAFTGLSTARAWSSLVALSEAKERGSVSGAVTRRFGYAVDMVDWETASAVRVYVDGHGNPRGVVPLAKGGMANVFSRSPSHGAPGPVSHEPLGGVSELEDGGLRVSGCGPSSSYVCQIQSFATPDEFGDWLFGPVVADPHDPFAEVNAFWHLHTSREALARVGLDDYPRDVHAVVNYRRDVNGDGRLEPFLNALYVPRMLGSADALLFGHTGDGSLAHDADVLRHELVHAATVHLADLYSRLDEYGYDHHPSVIAEAVADYFAATLSGDPVIGMHTGLLLGIGEGGVRRLDLGLRCPDDFVGLVHDDAQVLAGAFWEAREAVGPELDRVIAVSLRAMPFQPSIPHAASAILATVAAHLGPAAHKRVWAIFEQRGIIGCSRFVPLTEEGSAIGFLPVTRQMARLSPGPFQYRFEVPRKATKAMVTLERLDGAPAVAGVLHARVREPVRYLDRRMGSTGTLEISSDAQGGSVMEIGRDEWSSMDDPVIFLAPANAGDRGWLYRIRVYTDSSGPLPDLPIEPMPWPEQGLKEDDAAKPRGCVLPPPFSLLLAFLGLAWLRRRLGLPPRPSDVDRPTS